MRHYPAGPVAVLLTDEEADEITYAVGAVLLEPDADVCAIRRIVSKLESAPRLPCHGVGVGAVLALAVALIRLLHQLILVRRELRSRNGWR